MVGWALDHAVVLVADLERASADFAKAGFRVIPGGVHAGGLTQNALIPFRDGSYLELLAFTIPAAIDRLARADSVGALPWIVRGRTALDRRFLPRAVMGRGVIDLALTGDRLGEIVARGGWDGPFDGERRRPDGVRLAWRLAMPRHPSLPFLIEDVTDRSLRVPGGEAVNHPNGATGIPEIGLAGDDTARTRCERALGLAFDSGNRVRLAGGTVLRWETDGPMRVTIGGVGKLGLKGMDWKGIDGGVSVGVSRSS